MNLYEMNMRHRYEQVQCYSNGEFRRRWALVRKRMAESGVELALFVNPTRDTNAQWLVAQRDCDYLMMTMDEVICAYGHGFTQGMDEGLHVERRVGFRAIEPVDESVRYVCGLDENFIRAHVMNSRRVGIVGAGMRADVGRRLDELLAGCERIALDVPIGMDRAVKSPEERDVIEYTARVYESLMAACPAIFRRGRRLRDAVLDIRHLAHSMGAGEAPCQLFAIQCGMEDSGQYVPMNLGIADYPCDELKDGMRLFMLMEANSYGGHFVAVGRNFTFGEPPKETRRIFEASLNMQRFAADMLKPGIALKDVFDQAAQYITDLGFLTNQQNYIHSMGEGPCEMPMLHDGASELLPIREGMHLLVHPHVRFHRGMDTGRFPYDDMYNVDTYFVTKNGGVRVNNVQPDIVIL